MQVSIKEIRDNLADALNRVAYGGERLILRGAGRAWRHWYQWKTCNCCKNWRIGPTFGPPGRP